MTAPVSAAPVEGSGAAPHDPPRLWWIHEPITFRPITQDKP